jgi:hypothetical protein
MAEAAECVSGGGGGVDMGGVGRERGAADVKEEEEEEENSLVVYPTPSVTSFMALLSFVFLVQGALLAMLCYSLWLGQVANNIIAPPAAASASQKQRGGGGEGGGGGGGVLHGQCPQLFSADPSEAAESVVGACLCFRYAVCSLTFPCFPFFSLVASPARMHCGTARRSRCFDCGHVFFFLGMSLLSCSRNCARAHVHVCVCECVHVCMCMHGSSSWCLCHVYTLLVSCVHVACVVCTLWHTPCSESVHVHGLALLLPSFLRNQKSPRAHSPLTRFHSCIRWFPLHLSLSFFFLLTLSCLSPHACTSSLCISPYTCTSSLTLSSLSPYTLTLSCLSPHTCTSSLFYCTHQVAKIRATVHQDALPYVVSILLSP